MQGTLSWKRGAVSDLAWVLCGLQEKDRIKNEKMKVEEKYKTCLVDGKVEQVRIPL